MPARQLAINLEEKRVLPLELRNRGDGACWVMECPEAPVSVLLTNARPRLCACHALDYRTLGFKTETFA